MTAQAGETVRTEYAVRYPDGHVEALYSAGGLRPYLPMHAAIRGAVLVQCEVHEVRRGPWVEVPR